MTMSRVMILLGYLGLIVPVVLLWCSPWLPPHEGPPTKFRLSIRQLLVIIAVAAWFLAGVKALFLDAPAEMAAGPRTTCGIHDILEKYALEKNAPRPAPIGAEPRFLPGGCPHVRRRTDGTVTVTTATSCVSCHDPTPRMP